MPYCPEPSFTLIFSLRFIILIVFVSLLLHPRGEGETIKIDARAFGKFAGLGIQLGVTIVAFCFLGYYLDGRLGTLPLLTILGTFIGAAAAFYSIYMQVFPGDDTKEE